MKTVSYLLSAVMIIILIATSACKKESTDPQNEPPTITLQSGANYVSANTTVTVGTALKFGIRANPNANTGSNLTGLTFTRTFNGHSQTYDTTFNLTSFNVDLTTVANTAVGGETMNFTIKDAMGAASSVQVVVTTIAPTSKMAGILPGKQDMNCKDHWLAR